KLFPRCQRSEFDSRRKAMQYDEHYIIEECIRGLTKVQHEIFDTVWQDPRRSFEQIFLGRQRKAAAVVDVVAEWRLAEQLRRSLRKLNLLVIGEESLHNGFGELAGHTGLVALVDAIDGTRLLECGWDGWCSVVTVLAPSLRDIVCAVVAFPSGISY